MRTFKYAKVGEMSIGSDGIAVPCGYIDVIDPDTGKPPVDEQGHILLFTEVNVEEGWGIAYGNDKMRSADDHELIRIERRFELRETQPLDPCND